MTIENTDLNFSAAVDLGAAPETASTEKPVSIDTIVKQSEKNLKADTAKPSKRKRGRPRKHPKPARSDASALAGSGENTPGPVSPHALDATAPSAAPAPMPDMTPFLGPAIALPFSIAARRTGFKDFALAEDEKKGLAEQVAAVLNHYAPQVMNSPQAPAALLAGSILILAATKYMAYAAWASEQAAKNPKSDEIPKPESEMTPPASPAQLFPVERV